MNNNTVSYAKHGGEIKETYLNIINNNVEALKWLVITNDASNELFIEETGESLKDFVDFLKEDANKVKYGICKTIPPGSDVEKLLFIGFCSDYLPIKPKMSFMKNLQIVRDDLFNNYHVLLEIRDEGDLNYESISKRLGDAAGARYSIQTGNSKGSLLHGGESVKVATRAIPKSSVSASKSSSPVVKPAPVNAPSPVVKPVPARSVSPALKSEPAKSVSPVVKPEPVKAPTSPALFKPASVAASQQSSDDDWSEPPLEEKEIGHQGRHTASNWTPIGKVDLKKLIAEEKAKVDPRLVKESFKPGFIAKKKIAVFEPENVEETSEEPQQEKPEAVAEEPESENISEEEEVEEEKEEEVEEEKEEEVEEEKEVEVEEKSDAEPKSESDRKADIEAYLAKMSKKSVTSDFSLNKTEKSQPTPASEVRPPTLPSRSSSGKDSSPVPQIIRPRPSAVEKESHVEEEPPVKVSKQNYKQFGIPLPGLHVEEPEPKLEKKAESKDSDNDWSDEDEAKEEPPRVAPRSVPSLPKRTSVSPTPEPLAETVTEISEDQQQKRAVPPPPPTRSPVPKADEEKAKALFDYEADESNEISFKQGEIISKIEKKFEDWWFGVNESGESGVFPSNYVELV